MSSWVLLGVLQAAMGPVGLCSRSHVLAGVRSGQQGV